MCDNYEPPPQPGVSGQNPDRSYGDHICNLLEEAMNAIDELFMEIEEHSNILRHHTTLLLNAKGEISQLKADSRARTAIISLLDSACESVDIEPQGLTVSGKIDFLVRKINGQPNRFACATSFEIMPQIVQNGKVYGEITVKKRPQMDGSIKWAVYQRDVFVLNKEMEWEYEPIPSSRDDDFLERTRWNSLDEAWEAAEAMKKAF